MASVPAVLHIPELLESILLFLPIKELLLVQRVCKFWKDCIKNSVNAQQALFLRPLSDRYLQLYREKQQLSSYEWTPEMKVGHWRYPNTQNSNIKPVINPLIPGFLLTHFSDYCAFLHYGFIEEKLDPQRDFDKGIAQNGPKTMERMQCLHQESVSWREMLVMQPPSIELSIRSCDGYLIVKNTEGVKMQDVLKAVRKNYETKKRFSSSHWIECWDVEGFTKEEIKVQYDWRDLTGFDLLLELETRK